MPRFPKQKSLFNKLLDPLAEKAKALPLDLSELTLEALGHLFQGDYFFLDCSGDGITSRDLGLLGHSDPACSEKP